MNDRWVSAVRFASFIVFWRAGLFVAFPKNFSAIAQCLFSHSSNACYGVYVMVADLEWESVCQFQCFVMDCLQA